MRGRWKAQDWLHQPGITPETNPWAMPSTREPHACNPGPGRTNSGTLVQTNVDCCMAILSHTQGRHWATVEPEFLIGRSTHADLHLNRPYVSSQHAMLRWNGSFWEVRDLGSRNGTSMDSQRLVPSKAYALNRGARLVFGNSGEVWEFCDDSAPELMAFPLEGGVAVVAEHGMLALPSSDSPEATIFVGADGNWVLDNSSGDLCVVEHRSVVEVAGVRYRLSCPAALHNTATVEHSTRHESLILEFAVSSDEEHVALRAYDGDRRVDLGSRGHNYLLLTLARQRLADRAAGHPDTTCGWTYHDDLTAALGITSTQFNIDVFRIRQHFARAGLQPRIDPVERRPRSKQVRIGPSDLRITRV